MTTQATLANSINSIVNQSAKGGLSSGVLQAIKAAAVKTGVDFSYLVQKASQESGFDPSAKASTSSATGLFQFTNQTWLQMVKTYGASYGLGAQAAQITGDANGTLSVKDPAARHAILALRNDPQISAEMAGELDKANAASLQQNVGGKIGGTELYLAHFLGAGGASDFLSAMRGNPKASAAGVLPEAAAANTSVFYTKSGQPKTLAEIYQHFAQKFGGAATQVASASPAASPVASPAFGGYTPIPANSGGAGASLAGTMVPVVGFSVANLGNAAQTTPSTLFSAMVLGQMNGDGMAETSPLASLGQAENRKKDAISVLSAVA